MDAVSVLLGVVMFGLLYLLILGIAKI